ncbi:MAG TPA: AAA family ATPase [Candidatus Kapabacteria bacterium]|nr:AAA family ATPase [Candidatus Kapabacteria bacterium]
MQLLVDFLNHGVLPFTGRENERERLLAFWRSTVDAQGMRAALLIGEAGAGKSRLIEETIPPIVRAGGVVVHAKLYPESATSLAPLLAQELWYAEGVRRLLKNEPEGSLPAVVEALRRISRLRPTLLVIEDIHLLSGDAAREFALLLDATADEILSVLCATRPVELEARGSIERYLIEEIELAGLGAAQIDTLWHRLFDSPSTAEILRPLAEATKGNPLALRSALRTALRSDILARDDISGTWQLRIPATAFSRNLQRSVGFLAEGMAAHLSAEEKEAAVRFAMLGEVFARETACAIVEHAERLIDQLTFKGVLVAARSALQPLSGGGSEFPLVAFTHTLLHQHFVDEEPPPVDRLVSVIADGLPLYSILPFLLLARAPTAAAAHENIRCAIEHAIAVSGGLDSDPDWKLAMDVWNAASGLVDALDGAGADSGHAREDVLHLRAQLKMTRMALLRRRDKSEEYKACVDDMMAFTESMTSGPLVRYRVAALRYLNWSTFRTDYARCGEIWEQMDALVASTPEILALQEYREYLGDVGHAAAASADGEMLRRLENKLNAVLSVASLNADDRTATRLHVVPHLLPLFETGEELAERFNMLTELAQTRVRNQVNFKIWKVTLLESVGMMDEALATCNDLLHHSQLLNLPQYVFHCSLVRLCAHGAFGMELDDLLAAALALCREAPSADRATWNTNTGIYLTTVGLLRGDEAWTQVVVTEFLGDDSTLWPEKRVLLGAQAERLAGLPATFTPGDDVGDALASLIAVATEEEADEIAARDAALQLLQRPLLRLDDLLPLHAVLLLAARAREQYPVLMEAITPAARKALAGALAWLSERQLAAYMRPLLRRHEKLLAKREAESWRARTAAIERERNGAMQWRQPDGRLAISMLDTITLQHPGTEAERLRGPRLCAMLGLLVANRMLEEPLDPVEFRRLASGGEMDPDLARRTTNQAAVRLRESLGSDAITTGDETHELNTGVVTVDLLEAHALLDEAAAAERERALMRAVPAVLRTLEIAAGKVPFPGLYDDFFEAIRSDFEHRLRSSVIGVARGLLREGDATAAADMLRRAFDSMPEDEELSELLCDVLTTLGRRTEAERVRMQARTVRVGED